MQLLSNIYCNFDASQFLPFCYMFIYLKETLPVLCFNLPWSNRMNGAECEFNMQRIQSLLQT